MAGYCPGRWRQTLLLLLLLAHFFTVCQVSNENNQVPDRVGRSIGRREHVTSEPRSLVCDRTKIPFPSSREGKKRKRNQTYESPLKKHKRCYDKAILSKQKTA